MQYLIWGGTAVTLIGVAVLVVCAVIAARMGGAELDEAEMKRRLAPLFAWNYAALGVALIGLMMVVVGLILR
ncbi:hypothetical protein [Solirhodobacter olei]|uniref:hypothetical protein n=1 Tax=Solirhodobacter olei TaxID=2493082 RepID=UPI000FD9D247|nr:hypothetical protein [Solirhodobacter olei]